MLEEYKGVSNSPHIFRHLVGDTVKGAFIDNNTIVLVFSSGESLCITSIGDYNFRMTPSYWKDDKEETKNRVDKRREEIKRKSEELRDITFLSEEL